MSVKLEHIQINPDEGSKGEEEDKMPLKDEEEVAVDSDAGDAAEVDDVRHEFFEKTKFIELHPVPTDFHRVQISKSYENVDQDTISACVALKMCMEMRDKWIREHPIPPQDDDSYCQPLLMSPSRTPSMNEPKEFRRRKDLPYDIFDRPPPPSVADEYSFKTIDGVLHFMRKRSADDEDPQETAFTVLNFKTYVEDYLAVKRAVFAGPTNTYSYLQLQILSSRFDLHVLLNSQLEAEAQKSVPHRDFYNIRKVDTHVHHSACMNQKHLLRFIKNKLMTVPNEVVVFRDGKFLTLGEVFRSLNLTAYDLSIDTLDMHANNTFQRFDRFNLKYNPAGQSRLREIFLKTDNVIGGRYLAELTKEVMKDLEASKYQLVEWRISIYGRKHTEWDLLSRWFYVNKLYHQNVRWMIQVPRLYNVYKKAGEVKNFEEMLHNIFSPLYEVSIDPTSNPSLHYFLKTVVAFDSVDDESRPESFQLNSTLPSPAEWTSDKEPPYAYWMYYMYVNIVMLNKFRASRGLSTFQFRPHCGEAGEIEHLISTYLVAHHINHGLLLRKLSALNYLYYLSQIGVAMSPLSNNKLFLDYHKNPFPKYFSQGLNVSLSTDDPLMLHYTKDPLVEEYSVASQVWKFSSTDQSEIARNSVIQSGWEARFKKYFLGQDYNDMFMTNVPNIRLKFRSETLLMCKHDIERYAIMDNSKPKPKVLPSTPLGDLSKLKSEHSEFTRSLKLKNKR